MLAHRNTVPFRVMFILLSAHRSKEHQMHNEMVFKPEIVSENIVEELPTNVSVQLEVSDPDIDDIDCEVAELTDVEDLEIQLEHNVAALFPKKVITYHPWVFSLPTEC